MVLKVLRFPFHGFDEHYAIALRERPYGYEACNLQSVQRFA
jgi:hypothetical protein